MNVIKTFVCVAALTFVSSLPTNVQASNWTGPLANVAKQSSECGIMGQCHADSRVATTISVYINGIYRGTMGPAGDLYLNVGDFANDITNLRAVGADGRVWTHTVYGAVNNFHWTLY